jgi:hypothetical protein
LGWKKLNTPRAKPTIWFHEDIDRWSGDRPPKDDLWAMEILSGPCQEKGPNEWQWYCLILRCLDEEERVYERFGVARIVSHSRSHNLRQFLRPESVKERELFKIR